MVCDAVEIASGVGLAWARRDGAGVPVAAVVPSALSVLAALAPVGSVEKVGVRALAAPVSDIRNQLIS